MTTNNETSEKTVDTSGKSEEKFTVVGEAATEEVAENLIKTITTDSGKSNIIYPSAFQVTPENFSEDTEKSTEKSKDEINVATLLSFRNQAENDGYTESVIEQACKLVTADIDTYQKFEELMNKVISDYELEEAEKTARKERIKRSVDIEIAKLCKIPDIAEYADNLIHKTYQTTAVVSLDLIKSATEEELQLDLYQEPIFSIILQINKQWVSDKVATILSGWETREYPKKFVEMYLRSLGVKEEDFDRNKADLISYLPNNIQNEKSPDVYKQFKAVQLIQQQKNPNDSIDLADKIFSQTIQMIEYDATLQKEMEEGTPSLAATACATEAAIESMSEEAKADIKPMGIVGAAGTFCGKVVSLKYKTAKNFDDMMLESMGDYGEIWLANREAARARKEELKLKKQELKHEEKLHKQELKAERRELEMERKAEERSMRRTANNVPYNQPYVNQGYYNNGNLGYNNRGYHNQRYNRGIQKTSNGLNFAPDIPLPLIVAAVNVVLVLLVSLIFGKDLLIMSVVGAVVSFVGFLKLQHRENGSILTILGGYAIILIAILFTM